MNITCYQNFSKKPNSTARPSSAGTLHSCVFKDDCSVVNPVFVLDGIDMTVNYVQFNNRYYFVRDIILQNKNIYELHCEIDVLATWKSEIGSSTQYVLRSSDESDGRIVDGFYPTRKTPTISRRNAAQTLPWATGVNGGYYIIGVLSGSDSSAGQSTTIKQGVVQYYLMSPTAFNTFAQNVFTDANWTDFSTPDRYSFNPIQYISSVMWFPFAPPVWGQMINNIKLGWQTIGCLAQVITDPTRVDQFTFTIDDHPQASARGTYLNSAPFSEYVLKFSPFGDVELDGDILAQRSSTYPYLYARMETDFISGRSRLIVSVITSGSVNYQFAVREVQFGVNIQLAQIAANRLGLVENIASTAAGTAGSLITGNIPGAITGLVSGIVSAYQTAQPRVQTTGSNDSMLNIISTSSEPRLYEIFHHVVDEDNTNHGRPLCQRRQISSLPGYNLCANSEVSITGTLEEKERIQQYMDGGFFYE